MTDTRWTSLGVLLRETGGSIKTGPFGTVLKAAEYSLQGVPVISVGEVGRGSLRITDSTRRVGPQVVRRLPEYVLRGGDVVFGRKGAVDRSAHIRESEDGYFLGSDGIRVRFGATVDPRFMVYQLQSARARDWLVQNAIGTTMPSLNQAVLERLPIRVPPIEEQHAVAQALGEVDGLIVSLEYSVAKKQAIKQGVMQQLLTGRTRLPAFAKPWSRRRLSDLLSYEQPWRYLVQTSQQLESGRVPVLTAGKTFVLGYTNETHGIYTAHPVIIFDDFTTASKYVDFDFKAKSSAMKILSARPSVDLQFAYERMQLIDFPLGDHKRYWISEYSKLEIMAPDEAEQRAIGAVVADFNHELQALRSRLEKARQVKSGMMQQLLTGRTRLPVPESAP